MAYNKCSTPASILCNMHPYGLGWITCPLLQSIQVCLQKGCDALSTSSYEYLPIIRRNYTSCSSRSFLDCMTLKNMALWPFETSVNNYESTRHSIAGVLNRQQHRWENIESQKDLHFYIVLNFSLI
jgi:hypothetical protein